MHGRRLSTELQIETNKFYLQELTINEFFKGRPTLFDMFDVLNVPAKKTERQVILQLPELSQYPFVRYHSLVDVTDQSAFNVTYFLQHWSACGTSPGGGIPRGDKVRQIVNDILSNKKVGP